MTNDVSMIRNGAYDVVDPRKLNPHPKNPNRGDVTTIVESIRENGFYGTVVVQRKTNTILAGHHRVYAAIEVGMTGVPVAFVDVDDVTATKILLADNRTSELASRDNQALYDLLAELCAEDDLSGTGYDEDDLESLLEEINGGPEPKIEDKAAVTDEIAERWGVVEGQVWRATGLNDTSHIIICGSCLDERYSEIIHEGDPLLPAADGMLTDPPYGIDAFKSGSMGMKSEGGSVYAPVINDDSVDVAIAFLQRFDHIETKVVWGGNYFTDVLPPSMGWIVWDKKNGDTDFSDVELAWTNQRRAARKYEWVWNGRARSGSREVEMKSRMHPTQKPVGLHEEIIADWLSDVEVVLDGFLGSGTTAIACERTGKDCVGFELSPGYVALVLDRLQDLGCECELITTLELE